MGKRRKGAGAGRPVASRRSRPLTQREVRSSLRPGAGASLDRHALYELCVQSPRHVVGLLRAVHGRNPKVLGEDFCGTAAVSRLWAARVKGGRAVGVDHDAAVLAAAGRTPGVRLIRADVLKARAGAADVIFVGNFSIGEIHERARLVGYLRACRARLRKGGVFVCDTYGGESAFRVGGVHRVHPGPDGVRIRYTWEQRKADPTTGMVENAMHFRVDRDGWIVQEETDAFVYRWRLWSVPELREAMAEAGFARTEVYDKVPDGVDQHGDMYARPVEDPAELGASFIVCVAGRR